MVEMIGYCAADINYFNLYFDLWATQMNKFYPNMKKIIAVYNPDSRTQEQCQQYNIELREAKLPDNPTRAHFYLLRWLYLPHDTGQLILETQINCLAVKTQAFGKQEVDHLRIARYKRNTISGISAAVFTPNAAKKVVAHAHDLLENPYDGDHPMNHWQSKNLSWNNILAEQQFKQKDKTIENWCCWITAGTSQHYTAQQKLNLLEHYIEVSKQ